jgi:Amt family ammonium transporter
MLLIPLAAAGLAVINAGLTRSRNAAHSMLSALCVPAVAALAWFALGSAIEGHPGGLSCKLFAAGRVWDFLGADHLFQPDASGAFRLFTVMVAAMIPLGAGADRWRLAASLASAAVFGAWTFPLFAHWTSTGWLSTTIDAGGAGRIHAAGGLTALSIAWILGPRRGKYTREGMPSAIPGHSAVLVLFGCFLAWIGFLALNSGGAAPPALNTTLSAAAAALTAAGVTRARFGKPDASLCANGWVAGLVAASAGAGSMRPAGAVLAGAIGGALAIYAIELLELRLSVDDPGGAISVHGVGGIWSLLAAGWLGDGKPVPQLVAVATLLGCILPMTYGVNWVLNRVVPMRVAREAERQGLDLYELGAGAYPDFMSHTDDSWMR